MSLPDFITTSKSRLQLANGAPLDGAVVAVRVGGVGQPALPAFRLHGFNGYAQVQTNWCWAAAAVTIQRYLDRGNAAKRQWPQCAVVAAVWNSPAGNGIAPLPYRACRHAWGNEHSYPADANDRLQRDNAADGRDCGSDGDACWLTEANWQGSLPHALEAVGHLANPPALNAPVGPGVVSDAALQLSIRNAITSGFPVAIRIAIPDDDHTLLHFLVIYGYNAVDMEYYVWNPDPTMQFQTWTTQALGSQVTWDFTIFSS